MLRVKADFFSELKKRGVDLKTPLLRLTNQYTNNMSNLIKYKSTIQVVSQTNVNTDEQFIDLWLHGRPTTTTRTYRTISKQFLSFVSKPLRLIQLEGIHGGCSHLNTKDYKPTTIKNKINTIKSMFSFARRVGYCQIDKGRVIKAPSPWNDLAKRIVNKEEVNKLIFGVDTPTAKSALDSPV